MKKAVCSLLLAGCLLLSACTALQSIPQMHPPTSTPTETLAALETSITPTPAETPPEEESDTEDSEVDDYQLELIAAAEACRITVDGNEYYLDTSKPIGIYDDWMPEYPLYRNNTYLGTTGSTFQYFKNYIYIKSDTLQEDYPVGEMTRVIDLKTGTITPCGRNMDISIPDEGDTVYYTYDGVSTIFKADASLKNVKEFKIEIPEQDEIEAEFGDIEELCTDIAITDVKSGWIYFYYDVFYYEGGGIYSGNYRIRTDGTGLEKTDEGEYYEA